VQERVDHNLSATFGYPIGYWYEALKLQDVGLSLVLMSYSTNDTPLVLLNQVCFEGHELRSSIPGRQNVQRAADDVEHELRERDGKHVLQGHGVQPARCEYCVHLFVFQVLKTLSFLMETLQ
jgi:hypothetical protein